LFAHEIRFYNVLVFGGTLVLFQSKFFPLFHTFVLCLCDAGDTL
jgi:hypothetical protein